MDFIMNMKKITTFIGITLLSFDALSASFLRVNTENLTLDSAAHKLPQQSVLGSGWSYFEPNNTNGICIANDNNGVQYLPRTNGIDTGLIYKDGADSYPIFSTSVDGVGYALAVRQKGTTRWYPVTNTNNPISAQNNQSSVQLEGRMIYVKSTQGSIEGKGAYAINFEPIQIQCLGNVDVENKNNEIQLSSARVSIAQQTCEVKGIRQSVDLGVHDIETVRNLKVGENFGFAQQSITVDCPSKMEVLYTIADNVHPGNISANYIYLENESENPGFAVQVFESGKASPLRLGGDRALSSLYQYAFANTGNSSEIITKTFDFKYVKLSDKIKASDGNAQVTVTLVYK